MHSNKNKNIKDFERDMKWKRDIEKERGRRKERERESEIYERDRERREREDNLLKDFKYINIRISCWKKAYKDNLHLLISSICIE